MPHKPTPNGLKNPVNLVIFVLATLYIANLTFGLDLLPDNLPILGNLDEFIASYIAFKTTGMIK